jgi:hypothetical protein
MFSNPPDIPDYNEQFIPPQQITNLIDLSQNQAFNEEHISSKELNPPLDIKAEIASTSIELYAPPSLQYASTDPTHPSYIPSQQNEVLFSTYKAINRKELAQNCGLPHGLLFSPFRPLEPLPPCLRKPPVLCAKCRAVINRYCKVDLKTGVWNCVFCSHNNNNRAEYGDSEQSDALYPELVKMSVEYLDPTLQQSFSLTNRTESLVLILIDATASEKDLKVNL